MADYENELPTEEQDSGFEDIGIDGDLPPVQNMLQQLILAARGENGDQLPEEAEAMLSEFFAYGVATAMTIMAQGYTYPSGRVTFLSADGIRESAEEILGILDGEDELDEGEYDAE